MPEAFCVNRRKILYHITSGDTEQVLENLEKGILDFAAIVEEPDFKKYNAIPFPESDKWVAIVLVSDDLADKTLITPHDLIGKPLFCSE